MGVYFALAPVGAMYQRWTRDPTPAESRSKAVANATPDTRKAQSIESTQHKVEL